MSLSRFAELFCVFAAACALAGCGDGPLGERLREPENLMVFEYEDFGPPTHTYLRLGKPAPVEGVASSKTASGYDVGNIRILVTSVSDFIPQWTVHERDGWFESGIDYRFVWYFDILSDLDEILANDEIPEEAKARPRATREKILEVMGDADAVRERMSPLWDETQQWGHDNMEPEDYEAAKKKVHRRE